MTDTTNQYNLPPRNYRPRLSTGQRKWQHLRVDPEAHALVKREAQRTGETLVSVINQLIYDELSYDDPL